MAEVEVLLNPLLLKAEDVLALYADSVPLRVRSFRISVSESGPASYESAISVVVRSRPQLVRRKVDPESVKPLLRSR